MEFRHSDIRGGLCKGVRPGDFNLVFRYQVKVSKSRRDENNLLLLALEEKWQK